MTTQKYKMYMNIKAIYNSFKHILEEEKERWKYFICLKLRTIRKCFISETIRNKMKVIGHFKKRHPVKQKLSKF